MKTNALYYGDNLGILRDHIDDESIDLVYLDPPFNSNRDYNVIFRDESGRQSDASVQAFEDTWHWGPARDSTYDYLTNTKRHGGRVPDAVSSIVGALRRGIGTNQMFAYILEMTVRLVELRRVLKPTGSLYLHCDPTASHYLKLVLDALFGPQRFRSEVVWKRSSAHSDTKQGRKVHGHIHDVLLFYTKGDEWTWNPVYTPYDSEYTDAFYRHVEEGTGRRYRRGDLTAAKPGGDTSYEWRGVKPYRGRYWAFSKANMEEFERQGRLVYTKGGMPEYKRYLDEMPGVPLQDVWTDIRPPGAKERLGWATQKPLALLERIIESASNPGDLVLDPFCGCGTAIVAAQKLKRNWIGIDLTYLAIAVMEKRLKDHFPGIGDIEIVGKPTEVGGARRLAQTPAGRYQFQWFALTLVGATPVGGIEKVGADKGIDGVITFTNRKGDVETVIVSVKSGDVHRGMVGELRGSMVRDGAAIGLFLTLEEPTKPMRDEADAAGVYHSDWDDQDYPRIQILSLADLLERGGLPKLPPAVGDPFMKAEQIKEAPGQTKLFGT